MNKNPPPKPLGHVPELPPMREKMQALEELVEEMRCKIELLMEERQNNLAGDE